MSPERTIAVLASPGRRSIPRRLLDIPCRAGKLGSGFAISRRSVRKPISLAFNACVFGTRKYGHERIYERAPAAGKRVREVTEQPEELERFWEMVLEAFKKYAEKKK